MILDALTFIGPWPFRRLKIRTPEELVGEFDRLGVDKALVSNFQGIFYKDPLTAAEELMEELVSCRERFIPVPALNPSLYGWEADFTDMMGMGVPGIRLFPGYHNYTLQDPVMPKLLSFIKDNGLFVQIVARIEDERQHHWLTKVGQVGVKSIQDLVYNQKDIPFIISGLRYAEIVNFLKDLPADCRVLTDISQVKGPVLCLDNLFNMGFKDKLILGTAQPLHYGDSSFIMAEHLEDSSYREAILGRNLEEFLIP